MLNFYKKYWKTVFDIGLIILTVFLFMMLFSYLLKIAMPVFIALIIYLIIKPLANFLEKRKIKRIIAVSISTLIFIGVLLGFVVVLGAVITSQVQNLVSMVPKYADVIQNAFESTVNYVQTQYNALPDETANSIKDNAGALGEKIAVALTAILASIFGFLTSIPSLVMNFVVGIILAFFLALEIDSWKKFAKEKTPKTFKTAYFFLKDNVIKGLGSYVKSQLILITITFAVVFIGLLIVGTGSSFTVGLIAAVLDLVPLLGISVIFIPWIIYLIIVGNTTLAIKIGIIYGVALLARQLLEPKIQGEALGVSAFTMLSVMMISMAIFGVAGVVLSPLILILMKALIEQGYLKQWIRLPEGEFDEEEVKKPETEN